MGHLTFGTRNDKVAFAPQNLLWSGTCPEIQGFLHVKDSSRKAWKKVYFFLRRSGLYSSTKGSSKVGELSKLSRTSQSPFDRLNVCSASCVWAPGASTPAARGRSGGSERVHGGERPKAVRSACRLHLLHQGKTEPAMWGGGAVGRPQTAAEQAQLLHRLCLVSFKKIIEGENVQSVFQILLGTCSGI